MALFDQGYLKPGVYTDVTIEDTGITLFGSNRIPVLIGEGLEYFSYSDEELHRGSSATADDQVAGENISDQVTGTNNTFQLTYHPVVDGSGRGVVTTDATKIQVTADGVPVTVISLNGTAGTFITQELIPVGSNVLVTYFFKRTDTPELLKDLSYQIPSFATLTIQTGLVLSVTTPGAIGNSVSVALTLASTGQGKSDALAVTGVGTDAISIELRTSTDTVRTLGNVATLINAGIPTLDAGYLVVQSLGSGYTGTTGTAMTAAHLTGGAGQNSNTQFKVGYVPIVDGSNGGVVTTNPADITVLVNGNPVTVSSVDGSTGLFTLAAPVAYGSTLEVSYFTNTYQNTTDILPASGVSAITQVGLAPGRADFIQGTDFVLSGANNNLIAWGASVSTAVGTATAGYTPFDGTVVTTTLVDEKVYLRPVAGAVNSKNTVFTLADTPVDGSGLNRPTDLPSLVKVYVGTTPIAAYTAGAVRVSRVSGATSQVTLYNPPAAGQSVYASYYRSTLNDHQSALTVVNPGISGQGTYMIVNENHQTAPHVALTGSSVTNSSYNTTGLVWPSNFSDLTSVFGGLNEVVTLTFQNDGLGTIQTPAAQASINVQGLVFSTTTTGTAGNALTLTFTGVTQTADNAAVVVTGNNINVFIVKTGGATRVLSDIIALFAGGLVTTTVGGVINCVAANGTTVSTTATAASSASFTGGAAQVLTNIYANRFLVSSSVTGGSAGTGYLGQTYIDAVTALQFTIVDPANALGYGYTSNPSPSYTFAPGDTLTFTVSQTTAFVTGATPTIAIPGLQTKVVSTYGMNVGDTAIVSTFNKAGNTPNVGEFYYVSYTVNKTDTDFALQLYDSPADAYTQYGPAIAANRLSLGVKLLTDNGAQQFGCIQVRKGTNNLGADADYTSAIQSLAMALPGSTDEQKAGVIIPLSTSLNVQQYLGRFLSTQSGPRKKGEAIGFVGFSQFTTPNQAIAAAQSLSNPRIIAVAPFVAAVNLVDATGNAQDYAVSGEFMAAALAGLNVNPTYDVASSLTLQPVVSLTRLLQRYDDTVYDLMAAAGLTVLTDNNGSLQVRDYLTTDMSSVITQEPTSTTIVDAVRQQFRVNLKQFMSRKLTAPLVSDITVVCNSMLKQFVADEILTAYAGLVVAQDPNVPTLINVAVRIRPMFCLKYINVQFTVTLNP